MTNTSDTPTPTPQVARGNGPVCAQCGARAYDILRDECGECGDAARAIKKRSEHPAPVAAPVRPNPYDQLAAFTKSVREAFEAQGMRTRLPVDKPDAMAVTVCGDVDGKLRRPFVECSFRDAGTHRLSLCRDGDVEAETPGGVLITPHLRIRRAAGGGQDAEGGDWDASARGPDVGADGAGEGPSRHGAPQVTALISLVENISWTCCRCLRPVQKTRLFQREMTGDSIFAHECHGATEEVVVTRRAILADGSSALTRAVQPFWLPPLELRAWRARTDDPAGRARIRVAMRGGK